MKKLTSAARKTALVPLPGWLLEVGKNAIVKQFTLTDFSEALDFMSDVADVIEERNHHPEWTNIYNQIEIRLSTHDAGGITQKDIVLAHAIEGIAAHYHPASTANGVET